MALSWRIEPFVFTQGVGTKADPKVKPPLKLDRLSNARMRQLGKIEKRPGCKSLGKMVIGDVKARLENSEALAVYGNELLQFNKQSVYSYSEQTDKSVNKGSCVSAIVRRSDVFKNDYEQTQVDQAVLNDVALIAWEDSRGGVRFTLQDLRTDTVLLADQSVNGSATRPRCVAFDNYLYVFYVFNNDLCARRINPLDPVGLEAEQTISSAVNSTNVHLDVIAQAAYIVAAYNVQGSAQIRIHSISATLAVQTTVNIGENADNCLALIKNEFSMLFVAWHKTGTGLRIAAFDVSLNVYFAAFTVENVAAEVVTGYAPYGGSLRLFYQVDAAAAHNHYTKTAVISLAGSASEIEVLARSVGIASKGWAYAQEPRDRGFVVLVHQSTLQSTFFVVRNDGFVVAKSSVGTAGGLLSRTLPATVSERSGGVFSIPILTKNPIVALGDSKFLSFRGVSRLEVDFSDPSRFSAIELGDNTHILSGSLLNYDGHSVTEHNFHLYPENCSVAESTGGSLELLGQYSWVVCYEWTDAKGQIHRSTPSDPIEKTLTSSNNRATITVPTLRVTEKTGDRSNVSIVLYRTEDTGEIYYRASSPTSLTFNDPTVDTVTIVDGLADATLISRETLYTTGDVLENIGPPSSALMHKYRDRIFLLSEDDTIYFSKKRSLGRPVEFALENTITMDRSGGSPTAFGTLDDKFLIFKEEKIFVTAGEGPTDTGLNGYPDPEELSVDAGCVDAKSVVSYPGGIMFKSRKGFYLLTSDLSLSYVGADVERWNSYTVSAANIQKDLNEIIFSTIDGPRLVYNYYFNVWAVDEGVSETDAIIWKNQYISIRRYLNASAQTVKEVPGYYLDVDQKYSRIIGINWLSLAGLLGFKRVSDLYLLGEYTSKHKLRVRAAYDFNEAWIDEWIWDATTALNLGTYGSTGPYGTGSGAYGGGDPRYSPQFGLRQQKVTSVRFEIEEVEQDENYSCFTLSGIALRVARKVGAVKVRKELTS